MTLGALVGGSRTFDVAGPGECVAFVVVAVARATFVWLCPYASIEIAQPRVFHPELEQYQEDTKMECLNAVILRDMQTDR